MIGRCPRAAAVASLVLAAGACGKRAPPSAAVGFETAEGVETVPADAGSLPTDPREVEAWTRAARGGEEDRMRLEDLVGCEGLREAAASPALRLTAVRTMAYCPDFSELPWLVEVAVSARDGEALGALDAVVEQAARPRRATDPDDAAELSEGCRGLLALSRDVRQPRARRVRAIRALRMLAERGCVRRAEIPTDLDAK